LPLACCDIHHERCFHFAPPIEAPPSLAHGGFPTSLDKFPTFLHFFFLILFFYFSHFFPSLVGQLGLIIKHESPEGAIDAIAELRNKKDCAQGF